MNLRIAGFTLGCKVNQYDTEAIIDTFLKNGFCRVPFSEKADVFLINTCTVTGKSDRESKYAVRRAKRFNPEAKIIVTGCLAQKFPQFFSDLPGVVLVTGNSNKDKIFSLFEKAVNSGKKQIAVVKNPDKTNWDELKIEQFHRHTRAFVKIQDGCESFCKYCIVPFVRGKSISRPLPEVQEEIGRLANHGFKEIVLTGIRLGLYGQDLNPRISLTDLLKQLENEKGILRVRLSSLEPNEFNEDLIGQVSGSRKICPHFHIPLQSGDNEILNRMGRKYTRENYLALIREIKAKIPQATFSTDVMVGFPGEKEKNFANTVDLVKTVSFLHLHIFSFSPRDLTPAATFPEQIPWPVKKKRSVQLHQLDRELKKWYWEKQRDREVEILVEKRNALGYLTGLTPNYFRVNFSGENSLINQLVKVKIGDFFSQSAMLSEI